MNMKMIDAARAYGSALGAASGTGAAGGDSIGVGTGGQSFADLVQDTFKGAVEASSKSEQMAALSLNKEAQILDVVTAVGNAEMAIETVVAIRDRVINAYNDIIRMPI